MTISSTTNRSDYAGDGVSTDFATVFKFFDDTDLTVILVDDGTGVETTQVLTTDYSVTGAGDDTGGTVTMVVPPPIGNTLVIVRDQPYTQGLDLVENDAFPSESVERQFDKSAIMAQQNLDAASRSVRLAEGFTASFDTTLPVGLTTPNLTVITNATGDGFSMGPTASEISDAAANAAAAAASASAAAGSELAAAQSAQDAEDAAASITLPLPVTSGGTGAADIAGAQQNLGLEFAAFLNEVQQWTKDQAYTPQIVASAAGTMTLDFTNGATIKTTLAEAITTINIQNVQDVGTYKWYVRQGAGGWAVDGWPVGVRWPQGAPVMPAVADDLLLVTLEPDGADIVGTWAAAPV